jgi:4-hydroxy 2-oxovalerate aldolase
MAQMGTFTIEDFVPRSESLVSMVRLLIAYHCKDKNDTVLDIDTIMDTCKVATQLKELGYEVCINIGRIDKLSDDQIDTCAKLIQDYTNIDYLYIADTYGNLGIVKLNTIVHKIRQTYRKPIGFHGHDNLLNATVKSIDVSYNGVDMVDGTIGGIGRGSGNAKTELLVAHTVIKGQERYVLLPLLEYAEKWVSSYKTNHVLYFITGMYSMHVNYAIHLIENYDLTFAQCYDILMTVYKHQRHHFFDEKYLNELIF